MNNNTVGDNQNNGVGQTVNDMNNSTNTTTPSNDYNSMQPESQAEDIVSSLTGMPSPEVSSAPVGVQPIQPETTPPVPEIPLTPPAVETPPAPAAAPFDMEALMGSTPAVGNAASPLQESPTDTVTQAIPSMGEGTSIFQSTPVVETPPVLETPVEVPAPMETVTPVEESSPAQNLSQPLPSFAPPSDNAFPATAGEEIVSNLEESKEEKEGKGGTAVVIVLIVIIVALLITIGYFAFKIFFQ
jgi:hypothetical protein